MPALERVELKAVQNSHSVVLKLCIFQGSQQIFKQEVITDKVGGSSAKPEVSKQSKEKRPKHKVSGYKSQSKRRSIAGCRLLLRTLIFASSTQVLKTSYTVQLAFQSFVLIVACLQQPRGNWCPLSPPPPTLSVSLGQSTWKKGKKVKKGHTSIYY